MNIYKPVARVPDFPLMEREILRFWQEKRIFAKLRNKNAGGPRFSFLDGPITANNQMGVHHAWGRTLKDMYQRYNAMRGCELRYQNGFDCQGSCVDGDAAERARGDGPGQRDCAQAGQLRVRRLFLYVFR